MNDDPDAGCSATTNEIRDALGKILGSETFSRSPKISSLLSYLVEKQLAGDHDGLREVAIAAHVFNQGDDFNPRNNPIVRVNASRLRNLLRLYYAGAGATENLRIMLPDVGYGPEFRNSAAQPTPREESPPPAAPRDDAQPQAGPGPIAAKAETTDASVRTMLGMRSSVGFVVANFLLACAFAVLVNFVMDSRAVEPAEYRGAGVETDGGTLLIMMCKPGTAAQDEPAEGEQIQVALKDRQLACRPIRLQDTGQPHGPA